MNATGNGLSPLETARYYIGRGWQVIPIPPKSKVPRIDRWEQLRIGEAELPKYFANDYNVGVLNGEPSGWLVDIDLDHPLARELADQFLPPTEAEFGRASSPRSHRLYVVTSPVETQQWRLPKVNGKAEMIVELRSTGSQTVFPGSVHPSGQRIEWNSDRQPARVAPGLLIAAQNALAEAVEQRLGNVRPIQYQNGHAAELPADADIAERARKYLAKIPPAVSGQGGHDQTFSAACVLVQGFNLDRGSALEVLREWNQTCQPPWSDRELEHKIDDALQQPGKRGYLLKGKPIVAPPLCRTRAGGNEDIEPDPWPDPLADEAFYGLIGEIVRTIEPHSEADPVALLIQVLAIFGNIIGRTTYFSAEADRHYGNLFITLVGTTSKGRKGASWGQVGRLGIMVDQHWGDNCIKSGLSSGEGLIWAVRDEITKLVDVKEKGRVVDQQEVLADPGVADKRLLVLESELASVLKVVLRERNTLSAILRQAWETGNLRTLTKNSPARATEAHISLIGHITRNELKRLITETDLANGLANRVLWCCVRRSKLLPEGGLLTEQELEPLAARLQKSIEFARRTQQVQRDSDSRELWAEIYGGLSAGKPGLLGAATSRAEAQTMRLAMLYALLDCSAVIRPEHLFAGLTLWRYCEQSARYIFGSALGDPTADEILALLRRCPDGVTRNDIREHFGRNKSAEEISRALAVLVESGAARSDRKTDTGGRPSELWFSA